MVRIMSNVKGIFNETQQNQNSYEPQGGKMSVMHKTIRIKGSFIYERGIMIFFFNITFFKKQTGRKADT